MALHPPVTLGDQIANAGLNSTKVARQMGLDPSVVQLWANGKRAVPKYRLELLAQTIGVALDELIREAVAPGLTRGERAVQRARPVDRVVPTVRPLIRSYGERMEAYSFAMSWGPSPVPGRPRAKEVA